MAFSSDRRASAIKRIRSHIVVIGMALVSPAILSFIIWMVATASGSTATISYGLPTASSPSSIVSLWSDGPVLPGILVNLLNLTLDAIAFIVAGIAGITMVGSIGELVSED